MRSAPAAAFLNRCWKGPLVLGAYGFIWVAVLVYVWSIARRLNAVQKDFDALSKRQR